MTTMPYSAFAKTRCYVYDFECIKVFRHTQWVLTLLLLTRLFQGMKHSMHSKLQEACDAAFVDTLTSSGLSLLLLLLLHCALYLHDL